MILALYTILSAAMFYLGSRALITEGIWSYYPPRIARFMDCAACTGFWWGVIWHLTIGRTFDVAVGPLPAQNAGTPIIVGFCTMVLTPIMTGLMQYGLDLTGSATPDEHP